MIYLNLEKKCFEKNEKWPLLYLIAEEFNSHALQNESLTDIEMVLILYKKYNLKVERRTISQYRKLLSEYFGYKFAKSGYGHKLVQPCINKIQNHQFSDERIKHFNEIDYSREKRNTSFCLKAIKENACIKYKCPLFFKDDFSLSEKTLIMAPIQIFCYRDIYFLFAFCTTLKTHYIIRLDNNAIVTKTFSSISINRVLKNVEQIDLNTYIKSNPNYIQTGRINWKSLLDTHIDYEIDDYDNLFTNFSFYQNDMPEILITLYEKFGKRIVDYNKKSSSHLLIGLSIDENVYNSF